MPTTIKALNKIISSEAFAEGKVHVNYIEENPDLFIEEDSEEETYEEEKQTVNISSDVDVPQVTPPQMPKNIGMDLSKDESPGVIVAEMQGTIVEIKTKEGKKVKKGASLFVIEAMKMENIITSPVDGVVKELNISKGSPVSKGDVILVIEEK